jgi:ubiquinone/menaquinone biosynthesis C-methylase UbiE
VEEHRVLEGKAGVRQVYDEMADLYDSSEHLYWTRRMEEGEERAIRKWIEMAQSPLIDVGCGTGRYALKKAIEGSEVIALDISLEMIRRTVEKARRYGCDLNIHPILADGENLPFRERSFNSLICTLTFDHFERCELAASEFSRVLKDGGLCILTTFNPYTLNDWKRRAGVPLDKIRFQTEKMPPTLVYEVGHSANEIKELFKKHGFEVIGVRGCCYWHLLPLSLIKCYKLELDSFFNSLRFLMRYAELHSVCMKKSKHAHASFQQRINRLLKLLKSKI